MVVYFYLYTEGVINMNYEQLKNVAIQLGTITVEDCRRYTLLELVYKIANKVNEIIETWIKVETDLLENYEELECRVDDDLRIQNEKIKWMLEEGLLDSVVNVFNEWQIGGTFDRLINQIALKTVNDRIDETNAQLLELANKGTTVEVIEKATKEEIEKQINDGRLSNLMIETNSITTDKLKDSSVIPYKIADVMPVATKNLLTDVSVRHGYRYNNGVIETIDNYSVTDFIPVEPNHKLTLNRGKYSLATIFDEFKNFITEVKVDGALSSDYTFMIPQEGRYIIINLVTDWIGITTLTNEIIAEKYTVKWLELNDSSVSSNHLKDKSINLSKFSNRVFEGDRVYQYEFDRASSIHGNGYVMTAWFDISQLSDDINLKLSVDVKANRNNLTSFVIKAFQYDTINEIGGTGFSSSEFPNLGDEETFSNLSIETTLLKQKNILKVMLWAIGSTPSLPEVIQLKEVNVHLNNEKHKVDLENLGFYGTNSVPKIKKIEQLVTTSNEQIVASKKWVYELFMNYVKTNMNRLKGKKIGVIGDSYVYGHTLGVDKSWVTQLGKRNEMIYFNYGVNGGMISGVNGAAERYVNMEVDLDYVVVFGGHNDATNSVPIGNDTDTTITTFKGALNVLCKGLQSKYPKARILFMTPSHRKGNEVPYGQAIKDICYKYGIQVYDTYAKLGINVGEGNEGNVNQKEVFELVPLHLNELGNEYLSYKVEAELLTL